MCPATFDLQNFYLFNGKQSMTTQKLKSKLSQKSYAYTSEVTLFLTQDNCFSSDIQTAKKSCNIVLLDGVFMIYFERKNQARIHFFAQKNYYETQSSSFFVPLN